MPWDIDGRPPTLLQALCHTYSKPLDELLAEARGWRAQSKTTLSTRCNLEGGNNPLGGSAASLCEHIAHMRIRVGDCIVSECD